MQIPSSDPMTGCRALLAKAYDAFNARDIESVLATMHPGVKWPNGWEGGWVHGHHGVRDYWMRQWKSIDPCVNPQSFSVEEDGRILVNVEQIVRDLDGNLIGQGRVQHIYKIEDGLIKTMEIRK
jgi:SnoaL-like protein